MNSVYGFFEWSKSCLFESPIKEKGPINILPEDLVLTIFENAKISLPALASVNKFWKNITRKDEFYERMFSPAFAALAFGKEDLKAHFGIDIGPEILPRLTLKEYKDVKKGLCLLTYFPKEIPIEDKNGVVSWVAPRAIYIGELVKIPKSGNATCFGTFSRLWVSFISKKCEFQGGGEWVITYKNPIGYGKCLADQIDDAQEQGEGMDVAEFEKTVYAVFMHYVKTGERCFSIDPAGNNSWIRFKEKIGELQVCCKFLTSGLIVDLCDNPGYDHVGIAFARKSIAT